MKRIAVFVDGSNFKAACNIIGLRPDYNRMREYLARDGDVSGYYYFTALPPADVDSHLRKVVDFLQYNGWIVKTKEMKIIQDGDEIKRKGNVDIEIVVHAFRMVEYITDLYLFSGDGDFAPMVEELQAKGLRVTAFSVLRRGSQNMMADELRRQVNTFVNLEDIKDSICGVEPTHENNGLSFLKKRK